jgi:hypothetical protein
VRLIPLTGNSAPIPAAALRPAPAPATAVASVIARAQRAPVPVVTLTDEELAALDGPRALPVAPQPWLEGQKVSGRMLACQVALRSLAARGIVLPTGLDGGAGGDGGALAVALHQDLRAVLAMRRSALGIVLAQRRSGTERQSRMLYLHEGGVLEEDISAAGLHSLTVLSPARAGERLTSFTDPARVAGEGRGGQLRTVALTEIATGAGIAGLQGARYVTAVGRLAASSPAGQHEEQRVTVYAHADRVVLAEPAATADGEHSLALTDVSDQELRQRMAAFTGAPKINS